MEIRFALLVPHLARLATLLLRTVRAVFLPTITNLQELLHIVLSAPKIVQLVFLDLTAPLVILDLFTQLHREVEPVRLVQLSAV